MIRFGRDEYIRNFWFNLCIIMLMAVMMVLSTILISNIVEETNVYKLAEKYMDEDSIFLINVASENMEELEAYGELLATEVLGGQYEDDIYSYIRATVYTEELMNVLKPRLDSGGYPDERNEDDHIIHVLISQNPYGIEAGDTFTYNIFGGDSLIPVKVYVDGVLSEGQNLYTDIEHVSMQMTYEDFFPTYSYEQTECVRVIVPEEEMKKIPGVKETLYYSNIIINLSDHLSNEEKNEILDTVKNYDISYIETGMVSPYPDANTLQERNEVIYKNILMKYLPLCMIIVLLLGISIIGIITIKCARSIRYYGIMYTCGMHYSQAQIMAGFEMGVNAVLAFLTTTTLLTLQKEFNIVGEINCNMEVLEISFMVGLGILTILGSVLITRGILKEHTPVEILKNLI